MSYSSLTARMLTRALLRPRLLVLMVRVGWRFRRRGWYRRWPPLPLPPAEYLTWRMHTAFGDDGRVPTTEEVETYLRWAQHSR
jgi:hypothetical protein